MMTSEQEKRFFYVAIMVAELGLQIQEIDGEDPHCVEIEEQFEQYQEEYQQLVELLDIPVSIFLERLK